MKKSIEPAVDNLPDGETPAPAAPARRPRYSVFRFLLGGTSAIAFAAMIWPMLPRHYISEATLVIQPSGVNNVENLNVSAALRQPLDESAILSELDTLRSDFLIDRLMHQHALMHDPEFSAPGTVTRLRVQIAGLIAPNASSHAHVEESVSRPSAPATYQGPAATLEQRLLGISTANAASSGPVVIGGDGAELLQSPIVMEPFVDRQPRVVRQPGSRLADLRVQIAGLIGPTEFKPMTYAQVRDRLRDAIDVRRDRRSYTLQVAVRSEDAAKASALTQSFTEAYLDMQVERKRNAFDHLTSNVRQRAEALGQKARHSRAAMVDFMERTGLVDEGAQASLNAQLTLLSTEAATAKARAIEASARAASLTQMQTQDVLGSAPSVLESPTVQRLKQNLAEALSRTAVSPVEIRSIEDRIAEEQDNIVAGAAIEAESWTSRQAMLDKEIEHIRKQMVTRRIAALDLDNLTREAESDETAYRHALSELNALTSGEQAFLPDAELISTASMPMRAAFPNPLLFGLGALIFALLSGVALNFRAILADLKKLALG